MAVDYSSVKAQFQANQKAALNNPTSGISISPPAPTSSSSSISAPLSSVGTLTPNAGSGLSSNYQNLAGTNYYSTNAGNPNASYYNADGTPVASISSSGGGTNFSGLTNQENFNNILKAGNAQDQYNYIQGLINSGQAQNLNSIASISKDPLYGLPGGTSSANLSSVGSTNTKAPYTSALGPLPATSSNSSLPAYGSNVANFDPNNQQHIALANAGQDWARAKAAGDTAGMTAAAKRGEEIRAGLTGSTFDSRAGISTLGAGSSGTGTTSGGAQGNTQGYAPGDTSGNTLGNIFSPGSYGGYDPTAQEKAYLQMQLASLTGQNNSNLLSTQFGIDQNKAYLQEQLASLNEQEAMDKQSAQELQNRRGGFYSGGLDYQLGGIDRGYTQAESALGRDIGARNQQLIDQYGNQANTIAQQIQQLQFNQPDILRQRIQDYVNNERNYGLNYANTFGSLNGQNTMAQNQQNFNNAVTESGLTGMYNGQKTADQAQREWENRFNYGQATGTFNNGQQTLNMQEFEESKRRYGEEFAYQQARDKIADAQDKLKFDEQVRQNGLDRAVQWFNANTNRAQETRLATQGSSGSGSSNYDYKTDPNFLSEVALATSEPKKIYDDMVAHTQEYIEAYGYDGYNNLWNRVKGQAPKK